MDFWPQFCAVLLVFGLLAGALWMLKRGNFLRFAALTRAGRKARLLQPLESLALTPQHSIHLVRVSGRVILVSAHSSGCTVLESFRWRDLEPLGEGDSE